MLRHASNQKLGPQKLVNEQDMGPLNIRIKTKVWVNRKKRYTSGSQHRKEDVNQYCVNPRNAAKEPLLFWF